MPNILGKEKQSKRPKQASLSGLEPKWLRGKVPLEPQLGLCFVILTKSLPLIALLAHGVQDTCILKVLFVRGA